MLDREVPGVSRCSNADGEDWALEFALIHGPRYAWVAGTGAVAPVPEKTALLTTIVETAIDLLVQEEVLSADSLGGYVCAWSWNAFQESSKCDVKELIWFL